MNHLTVDSGVAGSARARAPVLVALAVMTLAVGGPLRAADDGPVGTVRVFAAASLGEAFGELARAFEEAHPRAHVQLVLAGSQQLASQIELGAGADVFASADARWMTWLGERSRVDGLATVFARNRLVVIVPRTNKARIRRLQDLARPGLKLVLGADATPVGRYAREQLKHLATEAGYDSTFAARVLANLVSDEENVKSVVGKVRFAEADAGVCYRSDVTRTVARDVLTFEFPDAAAVWATYPIAVLAGAKAPAVARAFVDYVQSEAGVRTLIWHRFAAPAGPR